MNRTDRKWTQLRPWRRHSLVLFLGGFVYVLYGFVLLALPLTDSRKEGLVVALRWVDIDALGGLWLIAGGCAILSTRWPAWSETWGYMALSAMATFWSLVYLAGLFLGAPHSGVASILVWSLVTVLWWGISGLRNPVKEPPIWED